jgi:dUTP pyrophosphatase
VRVKFKRFSDLARAPSYAKGGDSGADLHAASVGAGPLWPGETRVVWTDIGVELPEGYELQIRPRSSLSAKGILCHFGTVDSGYRGQLGVTLTNLTTEPYPLQVGDRVAQAVIAPVQQVVFEAVEELAPSERSTLGFGSTGR